MKQGVQPSPDPLEYPATQEMERLWSVAMLAKVRIQFLLISEPVTSAYVGQAIERAKAAIKAYKLAGMAEIDQIAEPTLYSRANLGFLLACTEFYRGAPWLGDFKQELNELAAWAGQENLEQEFWQTVIQNWRRNAQDFLHSRAPISEPGAILTEIDSPQTVVKPPDDDQLDEVELVGALISALPEVDDPESYLAELGLMPFWWEEEN